MDRWIFIPSSFLILIANYITEGEIELSKGIMWYGWGFYPMTVIGIVFCISLKELIKYSSVLVKVSLILVDAVFILWGIIS